ncbi:HdeD family acid-resistance protein [Paeniglutamicibacter sp. NPDC091659]|uniref:HdeD family acid-resistance protein n=1 Tax=Paeniglutamicibacter sp. NPDC091659 TaxID=3364389 RepID=UPI0038266D0D
MLEGTIVVVPAKPTGWSLILRGALAVIFAVAILVWADITVAATVFTFGLFTLLDGALSLGLWFASGKGTKNPWLLALGIVSIVAGLVAMIWPNKTAIIVVLIIGWWALALGVVQLVSALAARKMFPFWWVGLVSGGITLALGLWLVLAPGAGILAMLVVIATFLILAGLAMLFEGFKTLRSASA